MLWDRQVEAELERSTLRLRLAAAALASTLVLLSGVRAPEPALLIAIYVALAGALRFLLPRVRWSALPVLGVGLDILVVSALVGLLPSELPIWALFVFPIGAAALRYGPLGAAASTALSAAGYDGALIARGGGSAADLWPLQAVLAVGLVAAQLVWMRRREAAERAALRQHTLALRALAAARTAPALLETLALHAVQLVGAEAAWIWMADGPGELRLAYSRGRVPLSVLNARLPQSVASRGDAPIPLFDLVRDHALPPGIVARLSSNPAVLLGATFENSPFELERRLALLRDLVADAGSAYAAALERARQAERIHSLEVLLLAGVELAGAGSQPAVLAEVIVRASALAGQAAIVRRADGTVVAGEVRAAEAAALLARDTAAPSILVRGTEGQWTDPLLDELGARSAAIVSIGSGLALLAFSPDRALAHDDLAPLERLAELAGRALATIADREGLRRDAAELRAAVSKLPVPLVVWDENSSLALASQEYERAFVRQPLEPPRELATAAVATSEVSVQGEAGDSIFVARSVGLKSPRYRWATIALDITKERRALQAKEDAVAVAVHELRGPLTSVHGYAQVMARNLQSVQRQVGQLERLISDLLRSSPAVQPPVGVQLQPVDLAHEVREAIGRLRLSTDAAAWISGDPAVSPVAADRIRLAQVLDNILQNAAKFSPPGAPIEVELRERENEVQVSVQDRGVGIAEEDLPHIFERFYRSPRVRATTPGAGLGLAISKDIIEALGGRIGAASPGLGQGSVFWVALPRARSEDARERPPLAEGTRS